MQDISFDSFITNFIPFVHVFDIYHGSVDAIDKMFTRITKFFQNAT